MCPAFVPPPGISFEVLHFSGVMTHLLLYWLELRSLTQNRNELTFRDVFWFLLWLAEFSQKSHMLWLACATICLTRRVDRSISGYMRIFGLRLAYKTVYPHGSRLTVQWLSDSLRTIYCILVHWLINGSFAYSIVDLCTMGFAMSIIEDIQCIPSNSLH